MPHNLLADVPKLLCLAVALVGAFFVAVTWWKRQRPSALVGMNRSANVGKIIYDDTPTVRVVDSQRVDRMRKLVRLTVNESVDIVENRGRPMPRFRITLKEVLSGDAPGAKVLVEYGGTQLSYGPLVKEVGINQFVLPRVVREDPRSCVHHFHERGDALDFMRIRLRSIDVEANAVELDVMQLSGHWPTV